jgi:hypothetical protein
MTYTGPSVMMTIAPPTCRQNETTIISLVLDWEDQPVMDERGTEAESRELVAGIDGNWGVGVGLEKMAI